ncbi:hypothetical protein T4B_1890 [Trichinella pseudospiralis]|uniref:Uncharacterized protein n=1 Tax=Trichinella pseudospiralis TaxID=6337 RepID=A0A0V1J134_TRIPS|nr:hypothetical protein T4B_1890 [Trichinella pseudospiralis]
MSAAITSSMSSQNYNSERAKRDCRANPSYKAGKRAKRDSTLPT